MKTEKLNAKDKELVRIGKEAAIRGFREGGISCDVGGALITDTGKIYSGINMHVESSGGTSICGERSAIMQMISEGEKKIKTVVAVWIPKRRELGKGWEILPPCGICRHVMGQFGNPWVIISKTKKVRLKDLYPLSDVFS